MIVTIAAFGTRFMGERVRKRSRKTCKAMRGRNSLCCFQASEAVKMTDILRQEAHFSP
jgi:hypothetical protein